MSHVSYECRFFKFHSWSLVLHYYMRTAALGEGIFILYELDCILPGGYTRNASELTWCVSAIRRPLAGAAAGTWAGR